jgi:hypothetical protein
MRNIRGMRDREMESCWKREIGSSEKKQRKREN